MENQKVLRGSLENVRFPEVILQISNLKGTGVLQIKRNQVEKYVYFQDGRVVFARSTDPDERLGEVLLRLGKVTCRQIEEALLKAVPGQRLGTVLVQAGYLVAPDLYQGVIRQVEEILYDLFDWADGEFEFRPGKLPTQEVITLNISTPDVIVKGMSRIWRSSWIMKGVGPLNTVVKRADGWLESVQKLSIPAKVKPMLEMLENPARLEDFLQISPLNNFETCKWLWAFSIIGVIQQIPTTPRMPEKIEPPVVAEFTSFDVDSSDALSMALDAALVQSIPKLTPQAEASFSALNSSSDTNPGLSQMVRPKPALVIEESDESVRNLEIQKLNEKQRFIFERLRFEMGAGVANFLSKILKKVCGKYPLVFEGVEVNEFGELERNALNHNIEGNMFENYREAFAYFEEEQQKVICSFFTPKTVDAITAGLKKITNEHVSSRKAIP